MSQSLAYISILVLNSVENSHAFEFWPRKPFVAQLVSIHWLKCVSALSVSAIVYGTGKHSSLALGTHKKAMSKISSFFLPNSIS